MWEFFNLNWYSFSRSYPRIILYIAKALALLPHDHHFYASPTSGEAYRDRRLTTNFKLSVEIFCVPTCFHMRIPKPCLSVRPYPEKRNHLSFVNISPTLVIDTSMERFSRVLHHGNPKMWNIFKKFEIDEIEFCPYPEFPYAEKKSPWLRQYQSYISNWCINGKGFTSTTTWKPKNLIFFFFFKFEIEFDLYFDLCWRA